MNDNSPSGKRSSNYSRVEKRYHNNDSYKRAERGGRKNKLQEYAPVMMMISVILLSGTLIFANRLGLFGVTQGKPGENHTGGSLGIESRISENSVVSRGTEASRLASAMAPASVNPTQESQAVSPPEGLPEYAYLYPELNQPKPVAEPAAEKVVYLTFDDGPCRSTDRLLDVLDEVNVKAVFYVSGQYGNDEENVARMKEIYKRGHKVEVHTYTHKYSEIYASVDAFLADFKKMDDLIYDATGERSKTFRFPGGSNTGYNERVRTELLTEMTRRGYVYYDWNASNGDSDGYHSVKEQAEKVVGECTKQSRSIVLMHNTPDKDSTIDSLAEIVQRIEAAGYQFQLLDETVKPIQFIKPPESAAETSGAVSASGSGNSISG